MEETRILLKNVEDQNNRTVGGYKKNGGFLAFENALKNMVPDEVVLTVKKAGLRGRGGAGFPVGMKWELCASDKTNPKYLICNADEGEPGTFKDRVLLENDPFAVIEGMLLGAYGIGASRGYVYLRGEYRVAFMRLSEAIDSAKENGYLADNILGSDFSFDIKVYLGAGSYVCGEETALIESLEGKAGNSRIKPPFPVHVGLWGKPTVVNNVESLCNVPYIIAGGSEAYRKIGTEDSPGTKIYSLSGHVKRPGNYELPMGTNLRDIIYGCGGGIRNDKKLKGVFPGGLSTACLTVDELNVNMDFRSLAVAGSMLGSGAVIVMDEDTCMVEVALNAVSFYAEESCGKCVPCREGNIWIKRILERICSGEASISELGTVEELCGNMRVSCFCALGIAAQTPLMSLIKKFKNDFVEHLRLKMCPKRAV